MSEPAAVNTLAMNTTTSAAQEEQPPQSPVQFKQTTVTSPVDEASKDDSMLEPGLRLALFSTELATRPPRNAPGPPFAPPIARSNPIQVVVDTAMFWRMNKKLTRASWCIFPDLNWAIEDLWDAEDIHIYTAEHCREVLKFLSHDNLYTAGIYARNWASTNANRERLVKTIGLGNMGDIYDPTNHLAIVDKVFVNGEVNEYPRQFLWHVAHFMRTMILEKRAKEQLAVQHSIPVAIETSHNESLTTKALQPSSATTQPISTPFAPPPPPNQLIAPSTALGGERPPSYGPSQPGPYHGQQIGHIMGGEVIRNPKMRQYNHNMPVGVYGENFPQIAQSVYPIRPPSGTVVHSPHFNPAVPAMGQVIMPSPHPMQPYSQGYQLSSPSLHPGQPYHSGLARPGPLPQHQAYMPYMPTAPGHVQQVPNDRCLRGASFGDMTNTSYYVNNGIPHNMDSRRISRRNSSYGSGSLYDPYNGARAAFNDPNAGRKSSRGSFMDQSGRPRKPSAPDNRSRTGSYGNDWTDMPANGNRFPRAGRMLDDPTIVSDSLRGCHQKWIGSENHDVNELFLSDLPDNVQEYEVVDMFAREINITPVRVTIKKQASAPHAHAFVLFTTASEAKLGLRAGDADPKVRGLIVRITVPRRFYQKSEDYLNHYGAQQPVSKLAEERDTRGVTRMSSHEEESIATTKESQTAKLQYSPQDARSDLQKKKTNPLSLDADSMSPTDLDVLRMMSQRSLGVKSTAERKEAVKEEISNKGLEPTVGPEMADVSREESGMSTAVRETLDVQQPTTSPPPICTDSVEELSSPLKILQPVMDGSNTTTEKIPLRCSVREQTAVRHARVESQTKAPLEVIEAIRDGTEKVPMVVKIPGPANDDTMAEKLDSILTNADANDAPQVNEKPVPTQAPGSDDEADPDVSFQSAQEVVDSTESTSVIGAGSPTTNHGNEPRKAAAVESPAKKELSLPITTATHEKSQHSPTEAEQPSTATATMVVGTNSEDKPYAVIVAESTETAITTTSQPSVEAMKQQEFQQMASAQSTIQSSTAVGITSGNVYNTTVAANTTGTTNTIASQSSTTLMRNQGPQQTPSLNPFAKPSKSQRKKEKQQRKKKDLKTVKANAGETSTAIGSNSPVSVMNIQPDTSVTGDASSSSENNTQTLPLATESNVPAAPHPTNGDKGKARGEVKAEAVDHLSDGASTGESNDNESISGKQTGGTATNIPGEIGSVTHKAKAAQMTTTPKAEDLSSALAFTCGAQSPKQEAAERTSDESTLTAPFAVAPVESLVKANDATNASRIKKTVPAVPNININAKSLSTRIHDGQPSSASVTNTSIKQLSLHNMSRPTHESDAVSTASSATLHPPPSPTAEDFHTPLQTPTALSATQDQVPQPKKKKNKKKKKKPATASSGASVGDTVLEVASTTANNLNYDYTADPFGDQMSHIDAIREATKNPDSYYNVVNREMAEEAAKEKADEKSDEETGSGFNATAWRHIEGFLRENSNLR